MRSSLFWNSMQNTYFAFATNATNVGFYHFTYIRCFYHLACLLILAFRCVRECNNKRTTRLWWDVLWRTDKRVRVKTKDSQRQSKALRALCLYFKTDPHYLCRLFYVPWTFCSLWEKCHCLRHSHLFCRPTTRTCAVIINIYDKICFRRIHVSVRQAKSKV